MFDPSDKPRVFGLAPGVDFARALVDGLVDRFSNRSPDALARVELIVTTERMRRRIRTIFDEGPARLLPQIRVLGEVAPPLDADIPEAVPALQRRLELVQLVSRLIEIQPDMAPRAALFDLADSLAGLLDEMQGEGVSPDDIDALDISDQSGHWQRARDFLSIVQHYFDPDQSPPDATARQRRIAEALLENWQMTPPDHPILIAGSTGSRGATALLMRAVASLPQGALILPGFDFEMEADGWNDLKDALSSEDHPQFRFARLMRDLNVTRHDIRPWSDAPVPCAPRNKLLSLALRPAPVTDVWLTEGPALRDLDTATQNVTLLAAQDRREEALTIALRLREAAENNQSAALVTPDRHLTRQVAAALDRWDIVPDDSAGIPLQLTPPGRFLRHVAALFSGRLSAEALLALLKHPLCHSCAARNDHLRLTRDLELRLRRKGPPFPDAAMLEAFAKERDAPEWGAWLLQLCDQDRHPSMSLADWLTRHRTLAEHLAAGTGPDGAGQLWVQVTGIETLALLRKLEEAAPHGGTLDARDYVSLFNAILSREEQRDRDAGHPLIRIWGTLEARVMGADLLILGGLNEGSWPEAPSPDPWLNRKMRHSAGLLLPERRIGLSAHDFQQAAGAHEVWLTRSVRSEDAETVPSRWLNRLTNLLGGLGEQGQAALDDMTTRGALWTARAQAFEAVTPTPPAPRPSPRPPVETRPTQLSVTEIKRLIRDPYAIYARHVLGLRPLNPLAKVPDALLRGILAHDVMERFVTSATKDPARLTVPDLMSTTADVLSQEVPWPAMQVLWQARMGRIADSFVTDETARQLKAKPIATEVSGGRPIAGLDFRLTCQADRIDRTPDGALILYDYKTGAMPTPAQQEHFDKQLLLEAAIAEVGGFRDVAAAPVRSAAYIGLGAKSGEQVAPLDKMPPGEVWDRFVTLMTRYFQSDQGYTARRAMQSTTDISDYDQLARFGEWDTTHQPVPEDMA